MVSCPSCFSGIRAACESLLAKDGSSHHESTPTAEAAVSIPPPSVGLLKSQRERSTAAHVTLSFQGSAEDHTKSLGEALQQQDVASALHAIKHGANPAMRYGVEQNTALHLAAVMQDPVLMHCLVTMGIRHDRHFLNKQNRHGHTPLMNCIQAGDEELSRILILAGCDVNIRDANGWRALDFAQAFESPEIVKSLVAVGARGLQDVGFSIGGLDFWWPVGGW